MFSGCSESWFSGILASPLSGSDLWALLLGCSELWFTVFWLAGYLAVRIPWCTVPLASDSSAHLDPRSTVWMFTAGTLMGACGSRKASLGSGNPGHVGIEAVGVTCYGSSCRID